MTLPISRSSFIAASLAATLLASGAAQAQLKPSKGSEPLTPPATSITPMPAAPSASNKPELSARELAAAKVAADWLKLIDAGDYGKSWDESAPLFREKVTRASWVESLPKSRAAQGAFKARSLFGAQSRTSLPGAPDGEFVSVRFLADFEKATAVEEVVTLMFVGGAWRPLGYMIR